MKKIIFGIVVLVFAIGFFIVKSNQSNNPQKTSQETLSESIVQHDKEEIQNNPQKKFLFVPYWALTQDKIPSDDYDQFIYFGIAVNNQGIDKVEQGFTGLERFVKTADASKEKLLAVRMLDKDTNFAILKDKSLQEKIIQQTIDLAKQNEFGGIVLDLEISSLPFASVTTQMNDFVAAFYKAAKKENLSFSLVLFGDTFYKLRPYDVVSLVKTTDHMLIMAYDFHKAKGEPGPNFPFSGKETYGYDFKTMTEDFLNIVPAERLTIVFGMFGYDWVVDENGKAIETGKSLSLFSIKEKFINNCLFKNCKVKRDEESAETKISYIDNKGNHHIVWFEDEESVAKKMEFLKEKGLNSIGYWAYSYY